MVEMNITYLGQLRCEAVHGPSGMTPNAHEAALWTKAQLSAEESAFLRDLPLTAELDGVLFVHASARDPAGWHDVRDLRSAEACLAATEAATVVCGLDDHVSTRYTRLLFRLTA